MDKCLVKWFPGAPLQRMTLRVGRACKQQAKWHQIKKQAYTIGILRCKERYALDIKNKTNIGLLKC